MDKQTAKCLISSWRKQKDQKNALALVLKFKYTLLHLLYMVYDKPSECKTLGLLAGVFLNPGLIPGLKPGIKKSPGLIPGLSRESKKVPA
jgi:hypothetical protein